MDTEHVPYEVRARLDRARCAARAERNGQLLARLDELNTDVREIVELLHRLLGAEPRPRPSLRTLEGGRRD
jgi:hypothetical protein